MYGLSKVCTIVSIAVLLMDGIMSYCITHSIKDSELSEGNVSDILASVLKVRKITRADLPAEDSPTGLPMASQTKCVRRACRCVISIRKTISTTSSISFLPTINAIRFWD